MLRTLPPCGMRGRAKRHHSPGVDAELLLVAFLALLEGKARGINASAQGNWLRSNYRGHTGKRGKDSVIKRRKLSDVRDTAARAAMSSECQGEEGGMAMLPVPPCFARVCRANGKGSTRRKAGWPFRERFRSMEKGQVSRGKSVGAWRVKDGYLLW
jgi:hypothetical protein